MLQSSEKYVAVINGRIKEASIKTSNSYSLKQLSLILEVKRTTIQKWIIEGSTLPSWALQKLYVLPKNSGYIRSMGRLRTAPSFLSSLVYGCDSIVTKTRRDGTPMDIPATEVPNYEAPRYSLAECIDLTRKSVHYSSESFLSNLAAVGRKDK